MFLIQQITSDPKQKQNLILPDGSILSLEIRFVVQQYGWFITNLTYGDFVLNGFRIVNSPDMLYQFRNQIPFGLSCTTIGGREPTQQQDFSSGASKLYILDEDEVDEFSRFLSGEV